MYIVNDWMKIKEISENYNEVMVGFIFTDDGGHDKKKWTPIKNEELQSFIWGLDNQDSVKAIAIVDMNKKTLIKFTKDTPKVQQIEKRPTGDCASLVDFKNKSDGWKKEMVSILLAQIFHYTGGEVDNESGNSVKD